MIALALIALFDFRPDKIERAVEAALVGRTLGSADLYPLLNNALRPVQANIVRDVKGKPHIQTTLVNTKAKYVRCGIRMAAYGGTGDRISGLIIWPDKTGVHAQLLQDPRRDEAYLTGDVCWEGGLLAIAGGAFYQRGGTRDMASVTLYKLVGNRWQLVQHLESKYEGRARFEDIPQITLDEVFAVCDLPPKHLHQWPGDTLEIELLEWKRGKNGYALGKHNIKPSGLARLDEIAGYVQSGNHTAFNSAVPQNKRAELWKALLKPARAIVNGDDLANRVSISIAGGPTVVFKQANGKYEIERS